MHNWFIKDRNNSNILYSYKGNLIGDKFYIEKQIELTSNLDNNGNGSIVIKNLNENIEFEVYYEKGEIVKSEIINVLDNSYHQTKKLCQREGSETFKQCFNRESDEFCDDFVSTVAYYTNPEIPVIIAALCTC